MNDASASIHDASMTHQDHTNTQVMTLSDACDALDQPMHPYARACTRTHAHTGRMSEKRVTPVTTRHRSAMNTIPTWLQLHAIRTGDNPRLTGTRARTIPCPRCGAWTLTGYTSPLIASLATADPYPLTPVLEAAAVILHIPTYRLWGSPGTYELTERHQPGLRTIGQLQPATAVTVLAAHTCHPPLSRQHIPHTTIAPTTTDTPPY